MTYREAINHIHGRKKFSSEPTLARIRALMKKLGDPQKELRCIHIAGTNGKGSVSTMLASIALADGRRTGLFTSPYVVDFRERIKLGGRMIPKEELVRLVERIAPLADEIEGLNEFEFITAMAFCWFAEQKAELVVLETGLGGRYDPTNLIEKPLVSVITPIGLDHTEILGDTIAQIAFEKSGIIKPGVPVVTCPGQAEDALAVIFEQAALKNARVVQPTRQQAEILEMGLEGTEIRYEDLQRLHIPLLGRHQVDNALTALAAAKLAGMDSPHVWAAGMALVRLPARMELLCRAPLTILDGAHNPQGAQVLAQGLRLLGDRPITGILGVMADKDSEGLLQALAPYLRRAICVTPQNNPRALDAHELAARADALGLLASAAHYPQEAWELASAVAAAEKGAVAIAGSLYLAADMRAIILEEAGLCTG